MGALRAARPSRLAGATRLIAPARLPIHLPLLPLTSAALPKSSSLPFSTTPARYATSPPDQFVNPPASTRPPPLALPSRDPSASAFTYYFNLGKAYVTFYKSGLKAILANRRLLRERLEHLEPSERPSLLRPSTPPSSLTRADWVLLWRVRHDVLRLPAFGLVLLVCGEFTPLVVLLVDGLVPYTCRLPRQIGSSLEKAHERRAISFQHLEYSTAADGKGLSRGTARAHVLRSLHLVGTFWDRVGFVPPFLWYMKGSLRMTFLEGDDLLLLKAGGVSRLEAEEVKMACVDRGIDVLGRKDGELRQLLGDWLRLTAAEELDERRRRMAALLTTRPEKWPKNRNDMAIPDWHL